MILHDTKHAPPLRGPYKVRLGASGVHLFQRKTGLNLLFDEIVPPSEHWHNAPRQVSIALTNACDLTCAHCYAPKNRAVLSMSLLTAWLAELDTNGTLGVGFGGGEPTLYPHFSELCLFATKHTNLAITFTTHGHHLDQGIADKLRGYVNFIRVSMDGVGTTYERLRGRSFRKLKERLASIKSICPFGINYVVNSETFPELDAAIILAQEAGATEFLLLPEEPTASRAGVSLDIMRDLRSWITDYSGNIRLAISEEKKRRNRGVHTKSSGGWA